MPDAIRVAVIGVGAEAQWWERQADAAHEAGIVRARVERALRGDAGGWAEEAIHHPGIDAVCICDRAAAHAELITAALQAGKHVLAVPPIAREWESVQRMAEVARDRNVILSAALPDRHRPAIASLQSWVASGAIGDPFFLACRAGRPTLHAAAPAPEALETLLARAAGVTLWLLGRSAGAIGIDAPSGDTASVILNEGTTCLAWVDASLADNTVAFEVEVTGRNGYATARSGPEGLERAAIGPRDPTAPFHETVVQSVRSDTCGAQEWQAFVATVRTGRPFGSLDDTLALMRIFGAARRSARTGVSEVA